MSINNDSSDTKLISKGKGCKFVHLNCRSLYPKLAEISEIFSDFDFICLSETWLTNKHVDSLVSIPDKKILRQDRSWVTDTGLVKEGGAVAIYVSAKWSPYVEIVQANTCSTSDIEMITINVKKPGRRFMSLSTVYRPPGGNILEFINKVSTSISDMKTNNPEIWILGDFNINILERGNRFVKLLNRFAIDHDLKQLITSTTRLNYRGGTCIDLIYTDCPFVQKSGVLNDLISDHLPTYVCRKQVRNNVKYEKVTGRIYKHYDPKAFKTLVEQINWDILLNDCTTDMMWQCIMTEICNILAVMCPLKTFKVPVSTPEWLTEEII